MSKGLAKFDCFALHFAVGTIIEDLAFFGLESGVFEKNQCLV